MSARSGESKKVRSIPARTRTITVFARQLSTLLGARVPLLRSLETLLRQTRQGPFRTVLEDLADAVRAGSSLSRAMAPYPRLFDGLMLNMVRAGEASGELAIVLRRVAEFREKAARLRGRVKAAMVYPIIVLSVAVVIVALLMVFVIPQFQTIFETTLRGQELPQLTQVVIGLSRFLERNVLWVLLLGVGLVAGFRFALGTRRGRGAWDWLTYHLPLVKGLVQRLAVARFARTLGTLMESGVPVLEALRISSSVVGHTVVERALAQVHDRVRDGDPLARPIEQTGVFPALVPSMIEVGEETGQIGEMCDRLSDAYEEEVDTAVTALTSIIEPVMIVLLSLVVGTIVIALFLPIVSIIQNVGSGR